MRQERGPWFNFMIMLNGLLLQIKGRIYARANIHEVQDLHGFISSRDFLPRGATYFETNFVPTSRREMIDTPPPWLARLLRGRSTFLSFVQQALISPLPPMAAPFASHDPWGGSLLGLSCSVGFPFALKVLAPSSRKLLARLTFPFFKWLATVCPLS